MAYERGTSTEPCTPFPGVLRRLANAAWQNVLPTGIASAVLGLLGAVRVGLVRRGRRRGGGMVVTLLAGAAEAAIDTAVALAKAFAGPS